MKSLRTCSAIIWGGGASKDGQRWRSGSKPEGLPWSRWFGPSAGLVQTQFIHVPDRLLWIQTSCSINGLFCTCQHLHRQLTRIVAFPSELLPLLCVCVCLRVWVYPCRCEQLSDFLSGPIRWREFGPHMWKPPPGNGRLISGCINSVLVHVNMRVHVCVPIFVCTRERSNYVLTSFGVFVHLSPVIGVVLIEPRRILSSYLIHANGFSLCSS